MLSISVPMKGAGKGEYYLHLAREDYYFNKGEPLGVWHGRGADRLGLSGRIVPTVLRRMLNGQTPDGKRNLVQNARHKDRQSAWDLTFSAPKSVSVLWAMAPESVRVRIEAANRAALHVGLAFLQEKAALTRRGKGGRTQEPADFIFATFRHSTSREQDPLIHNHALLINACVRQDGSTGAVWSKVFFRIKKQAGAVYCKALAAEMENGFGLQVEWEKSGFHIIGVPRQLCDVFSKRSKQIKAYMAEHHESGAIAAKKAALATRRKKAVVNRQVLFRDWRRTGEGFGWSTAQVEQLLRNAEVARQDKIRKQEAKAVTNTQHTQSSELSTQDHVAPPISAEAKKDPKSDESSNSSPATQSANQAERVTKTHLTVTSQKGWEKRQFKRKQRSARTESYQRHQQREQRQKETHSASNKSSRPDNPKQRTPLVRIEWKRLFPKAPHWSPAQKLKLPRIVIGRKPQPRWGRIRWRKNLLLAELRLQQRRLFPKAPGWSPAKDWTFPTLRIVPPPPIIKRKKQVSNEQKSSYSHGH